MGLSGTLAVTAERLGWRSRMARRLMMWTSLFGLVGIVGMVLWSAAREQAEHVKHVRDELASVGEVVAPVMVQSLWEFDRKNITLQMEALSRLPYVSAVILDIRNQPSIRRGSTNPAEHVVEKSIRLVYAEDGANEVLGTLTLVHDGTGEQAIRRRRLLLSILGNALIVLITALGSVAIYQMLVTRRLIGLSRQLRGITAEDLLREPEQPVVAMPATHRDELDELAEAIGALKATGAQAMRQIDIRHSQIRSLMDSLPDLVWLKDVEGVYLACNPRFAEFFGRTEAEFLGRTDYDFYDRELADFFRENDRLATVAGGPRTNEEWLTSVAGYRGLFETVKSPVRTSDGRLIGVLGFARDITAQRRYAETLREREELYHSIVSQAGDGIHLMDTQTLRILEVNEAACRLTGYTREEYLRLNFMDLIADDDSDETAVRERVLLMPLEVTQTREGRYRAKDGHLIDVHRSVRRITLRGRDCVLAVWRDISQEKAAQQAVANAAEWHRALIHSTVDGIAILDEQRCVIECNPRFAEMLGTTPQEMVGRHPSSWDDFEGDAARISARHAAATGPSISFETRHRRADGGTYDAEVSVQAVRIGGRQVYVVVSRDVSARVKAREDLRAREEIFRSIVSQAGDAIVLLDPSDGRFVEFNDAACSQLGYDREAFAALTLFDLQADLGRESLARTLDSVLEGTGTAGDLEWRHRHRDGSTRDVLVSQRSVRVRGRDLIAAVWHDVTRRKADEAAIRAERLMRERIIEAFPGLFYALDWNGQLVFWNKHYEEACGLSAEALAGRRLFEGLEGPAAARVAEHLRAAMRHGRSAIDVDLPLGDGDAPTYHLTALRLELDERLLILGAGLDISALKRAEGELKQLNAGLEERVQQRTADLRQANRQLVDTQLAMDSVGIGISWIDYDSGRFIDANPHNARFLGHELAELRSMSVWEVETRLSAENYTTLREKVRQAGYLRYETVVRTRNDERIPVELTIYYQGAEGDMPARFISFMTDIRRRKEAEQALQEAKAASEAASRAKSAFLANMSHEIRTPLNAISGMAHLIRRGGLAPQQAERMSKLEGASEHLLGIIDAVLELSKIEAGKFALTRAPVQPQAVLSNVVSMLHDRAAAKRLALTSEIRGSPRQLVGDPTRLQQALLNYATNAVKFTDHGQVTLRAILVEEDATQAWLRFEVEDTGIGIPPEVLPRLFNAFEQADNSATREHGGTGLGLAITRKIAELMDGEAGARSTPGKGSLFWFTVRLDKAAAEDRGTIDPLEQDAEQRLRRECSGRRVLLVEDEPINREVAVELLRDTGLSVRTAEDGLEALELARTGAYDLVLMDMQMPRLDGLAATRALRAMPEWRNVPIVAMTANAFEEDRRACEAAGMSGFVSKPVEPRVLYATVLKWLSGASPAPGAGEATTGITGAAAQARAASDPAPPHAPDPADARAPSVHSGLDA